MRSGKENKIIAHKQMLFRSEARETILRGGGLTLLRTIDALENAVSVTSVLLLTEATLTEIPEANPKTLPDGEGGLE